ncbi:hypothetical protein O4G76_04445 [Limimaricola sp. G21655-S1]|nr:hypothetical protein [Limimaricola sp. G21655-S1]MCZ4260088.1 hypothetical protein [Limimaricola sp. G21655-S1]
MMGPEMMTATGRWMMADMDAVCLLTVLVLVLLLAAAALIEYLRSPGG